MTPLGGSNYTNNKIFNQIVSWSVFGALTAAVAVRWQGMLK
jgi:hypothetical protein